MIESPRMFPDFVGQRGMIAQEDGYRRVLLDRIRLIAREDGSMDRASELLPEGTSTVDLPTRLGGGFLFVGRGSGTPLWRATSWLAKLEPLIQLSGDAREVVAGFDRIYLRLTGSNRIVALDPRT